MIRIYIQGLKDGEYPIDSRCQASEIPDMFPEFEGDVQFTGSMKIIGKRVYIEGKASSNADLVCDRTLAKFKKLIEAEIKIDFLLKGNSIRDKNKDVQEEIRAIYEDEKYIDISAIVREELALHLPMRRIAPEFENKELDEIYPELAQKESYKAKDKFNIIDERWAPLKNIKIN